VQHARTQCRYTESVGLESASASETDCETGDWGLCDRGGRCVAVGGLGLGREGQNGEMMRSGEGGGGMGGGRETCKACRYVYRRGSGRGGRSGQGRAGKGREGVLCSEWGQRAKEGGSGLDGGGFMIHESGFSSHVVCTMLGPDCCPCGACDAVRCDIVTYKLRSIQ